MTCVDSVNHEAGDINLWSVWCEIVHASLLNRPSWKLVSTVIQKFIDVKLITKFITNRKLQQTELLFEPSGHRSSPTSYMIVQFAYIQCKCLTPMAISFLVFPGRSSKTIQHTRKNYVPIFVRIFVVPRIQQRPLFVNMSGLRHEQRTSCILGPIWPLRCTQTWWSWMEFCLSRI